MGVWPLRFRAVKAFGYSAINCGTRRQSRSELPQALCKGKLPFLPASCVMSGCLTIRNSTVVLCPYSQADIATVKILSARHIRGPKQLDYWCLRSVAHSPVQQAPAILGVQEDGRMVGWSDGRIVVNQRPEERQQVMRRQLLEAPLVEEGSHVVAAPQPSKSQERRYRVWQAKGDHEATLQHRLGGLLVRSFLVPVTPPQTRRFFCPRDADVVRRFRS